MHFGRSSYGTESVPRPMAGAAGSCGARSSQRTRSASPSRSRCPPSSSVRRPADRIQPSGEIFLFLFTLPMWLVLAKLQGLYERDEERADHSTVDEFAGVLVIVTLGTWLFQSLSWMTGLASPQLGRLVAFWLLAIGLVTTGRAVARSFTRRSGAYAMRTVVVGAGEIGQLVARKIAPAPGVRTRSRRLRRREPLEQPLRDAVSVGRARRRSRTSRRSWPSIEIDRVVVAFSNEPDAETMELVRSLRDLDVIRSTSCRGCSS